MGSMYLKGIGMMVGMMFGAGIFALPYAISQAGLLWGVIHFVAAFVIIFFLQYLYCDVAFFTRGKHRFTGYVEIFLGKKAKRISFFTTILSYYGSLLVYGILGGIFISNFFNGAYKFEISLLFFAVCGILLLLNLSKIAEINFYLTMPLLAFVIYLLFVSFPEINFANFTNNLSFNFNQSWFLPYGVWFFSLCGFAAIPETRDIFSKSSIKEFKRVVFWSLIITSIFYFIFIFSVLGASASVTEDALFGMMAVLGQKALLIGSFIGLLAVITSFIALAIDLRSIFEYDYKFSKTSAWFLTIIPPVAIFLSGIDDFVKALSVIGALGLGVLGIFIILMARKLRKIIKEGDTQDLLKEDYGEYTTPSRFVEIIVLIGVLAGAIFEIVQIFT